MKKALLFSAVTVVIALLSSCGGESITLTDSQILGGTLTLNVHDNHLISYIVEPEGTPVTWTSSNPGIAFVLGDWIAANATGTAVITGTTPKGATTQFSLYVNPAPVVSFSIPASLVLYVGQTVELPVTDINPSDADAGSIVWNSSEGGVISWVVSEGKVMVTGVGMGVTEFNGTGTGGADETCVIRVRDVEFKLAPENISLLSGASGTFTLTQEPVVFDSFDWSIADGSVASIVSDGNKCTVTAGSKQGSTTVSVCAGPYKFEGGVKVIGDDYQPYILTNIYASNNYNQDKWPNRIIRQQVMSDGQTIYVAPGNVLSGNTNGYCISEERRVSCGPCFEDGSRLPAELTDKLEITFKDPDKVSFENYIWDNSHFWARIYDYKPGKKDAVTITTPAGKSCTVYFVSAIKKFGISKIDMSNKSANRENLGTTDAEGTITLSLSTLDTSSSARYSVDVTGMECHGYSLSGPNVVTSSNTNVAKVGTSDGYSYLNFNNCSKGSTKIAVKTGSDVTVASFTLVIN